MKKRQTWIKQSHNSSILSQEEKHWYITRAFKYKKQKLYTSHQLLCCGKLTVVPLWEIKWKTIFTFSFITKAKTISLYYNNCFYQLYGNNLSTALKHWDFISWSCCTWICHDLIPCGQSSFNSSRWETFVHKSRLHPVNKTSSLTGALYSIIYTIYYTVARR